MTDAHPTNERLLIAERISTLWMKTTSVQDKDWLAVADHIMEREQIVREESYKQGWNDRESDILERAGTILPTPDAEFTSPLEFVEQSQS